MKISAIKVDITTLRVDAIVNAANNQLSDGSGVNGAIQQAAGPELLQHCATLGGCKTGQAKITPGFRLPAKYIIHTVGPVWHGGTQGEAELLTKCYESCLEIADLTADIDTIVFPAISTGVFGYPAEDATDLAVSTVLKNASNLQITKVIFACFDENMLALYNKYL